jgi:hypothetical protein
MIREGFSRPPVSRREKIIAVWAVACLVFSTCAFSSVPMWAQWGSLILAASAFAFLFLPVGYDNWLSKTPRQSWEALRKFPPFWLGLVLFILMAVQGFNPAWGVVQRTFYWKIFAMDYVTWLPSGVAGPFDSDETPGGMNAFRQMIIFGGPWLLLCALWVGVERRRTWIAMGWILMLVTLVLVGWGSEMRISHAAELNADYNIGNSSFFGPFLYQNQAGAWVSLILAVSVAVSLWHWENAVARAARSGPHVVCVALIVLLALGIVCTLSFGGMLTSAGVLLGLTPIALLWTLTRSEVSRGVIYGGVVVTLLVVVMGGIFLGTADLSKIEDKLRAKFQLMQKNTLDDRAPLRRATWAMITNNDNERVWAGYGAGSYRWVSPAFFRAQKEFRSEAGKLLARANYAHCDWLQMIAEWGILGGTLVVLALLWGAQYFLKNFRRWLPTGLVLVGAVILFMVHAGMDFLCYSMPLLGLVAFVVTCTARLGLRPA